MQAHKFVGVNNPDVGNFIEDIACARSPEEAARMGRRIQRQRPDLVCLSNSVVSASAEIN